MWEYRNTNTSYKDENESTIFTAHIIHVIDFCIMSYQTSVQTDEAHSSILIWHRHFSISIVSLQTFMQFAANFISVLSWWQCYAEQVYWCFREHISVFKAMWLTVAWHWSPMAVWPRTINTGTSPPFKLHLQDLDSKVLQNIGNQPTTPRCHHPRTETNFSTTSF
jgi:hypothetical protein